MECSDRRNSCRRNRLRLRLTSLGLAFLFFAVLVANGRLFSQGLHDEVDIRSVLEGQVAAWNRGDVDGYMTGYWNSDSTVFVSGGTMTTGYREVLARYKKNYNTPEKMGTLNFRSVTVRLLTPKAAIASGIWELVRKSDRPWGRFTLILEKKVEGWRITHDHTSTAQ